MPTYLNLADHTPCRRSIFQWSALDDLAWNKKKKVKKREEENKKKRKEEKKKKWTEETRNGARVRNMKLRTRSGHLEDHSTKIKTEYRNQARFWKKKEYLPKVPPKGPHLTISLQDFTQYWEKTVRPKAYTRGFHLRETKIIHLELLSKLLYATIRSVQLESY